MDTKNTRTSQILLNNKWVDVDMLKIKIGMKFRLFESDGTPADDGGFGLRFPVWLSRVHDEKSEISMN